MTSKRAEKIFYLLLVFIAIATCVGAVLLISQSPSAELALFELLAFGISITAVILAVLGALNSIHQARVMRRIANEMREAITELKDINHDNESIKYTLKKDYTLAKAVVEALSEAGIIEEGDETRPSARK